MSNETPEAPQVSQAAIDLENFVRAGFHGIWVRTQEPEVITRDISILCEAESWGLLEWDAAEGLRPLFDPADTKFWVNQAPLFVRPPVLPAPSDPLTLLYTIEKASTAVTGSDLRSPEKTIVLLRNFHSWLAHESRLKTTLAIQALQNLIYRAKLAQHGGVGLVFLSPNVDIPGDLDNHLVVVEHALPSRQQLWQIAERLVASDESLKDTLPSDEAGKSQITAAAAGLTARNAEDAMSLSIIKSDTINADVIWGVKAQMLKKQRGLELLEGQASFDELGGLKHFKDFTKTLLSKRHTDPRFYPRGLLLLGVSGSGKSASVKCLSKATGRKIISLNIGSLRSKFQGESDMFTRRALETADVMAPCILYVDQLVPPAGNGRMTSSFNCKDIPGDWDNLQRSRESGTFND